MESLSSTPEPSQEGRGELPGLSTGELERRGDPLGKHLELPRAAPQQWPASASKECPQPHEETALGFWNTNPEPRRSFTKSTVVPFR
jgi:hypothetical protein